MRNCRREISYFLFVFTFLIVPTQHKVIHFSESGESFWSPSQQKGNSSLPVLAYLWIFQLERSNKFFKDKGRDLDKMYFVSLWVVLNLIRDVSLCNSSLSGQ